MRKRQKEVLEKILSNPVQWDCSMKRYTSFSVGGTADALVRVQNNRELQELLCFLEQDMIGWRVVGKGTNILVRDEGFSGIIILLAGEFETIVEKESKRDTSVILEVGCGCGIGRLGRYCADKGFSGLEFTTGIPGSLGGAVLMNAGAWGKEMASVVKKISLLTRYRIEQLENEDLDFAYRCWPGFEKYKDKAVIVKTEIKLKKRDAGRIEDECRDLLEKRKKKQPIRFANAGSFFKNPPGDSAGRLIEASGLKGMSVGEAMVSEQHANFLVNRGGATARDILSLMAIVQEKVGKDSGVDLHPEIHII